MSNNAMSNETNLDWLARNVHVWREGKREVLVCWPRNVDTLIWSCGLSNTGWITKEQWLARRAELQNKPSWVDFRASAKFMAQDSDGTWRAFEIEPAAQSHIWNAKRGWRGYAYEETADNRGEVLGDWLDTLEKRPEEFKPFTSIEDNQDQVLTQQQDSGWFERGELPPVGMAVQLWHGGTYAYDCELIAKRGNNFVLWNLTWDRPDSADCMMCEFKPTPTERDVLLSVIVEEMNHYDTDGKLADAILAAGFSLRDK